MKTNSPHAWLLATRPATLSGALSPVAVALSLSFSQGCFQCLPALLCVLFALLMQIDANFANDYLDYLSRTDGPDRLGPPRACAQGWITPRAMLRGILLTTLLASLVGLPLVIWGGWWMVAIGLACILCCMLYSTLARRAMGDILVILFFGIVPVTVTYYLQNKAASPEANFQSSIFNNQLISAALAMGLVTDCLLLVNNYRDRDTDSAVGKHTLVTLIGPRATEWLYLLLGLVAFALCFPSSRILLFFLPFHFYNWLQMRRIHEGHELNRLLGKTAASILLFAILYSVGVIVGIS